jgi:hypothetical protein
VQRRRQQHLHTDRLLHAGGLACKNAILIVEFVHEIKQHGGSFGALRSLGLVGVVLREGELNGWGGLVGVVLVVLAQENNFIVGLARAWRCSAAAGADALDGRVIDEPAPPIFMAEKTP